MTGNGPLISLDGVGKRFGDVVAAEDVVLDLAGNEFFALLGPSSCGKTTLLRILAGFERPDSGRIRLDGHDITDLRPSRRPLNMMFQSYALFPHMSVEKNVSYGLESERLARTEINRRVGEVLAMTRLEGLARRRPHQLSGGQRQRVALARAIVKRPRVLLLDEPLAALDKSLREQMQLELKRLQHEVGITFVVVTHDQAEALVMADRIAVMNAGRLVQVGTPRELYEHPRTRFVAGFIGMMNLFEGRVDASGMITEGGLVLAGGLPNGLASGSPATLAVRPERVRVSPQRPADGCNRLSGRIAQVAYHGQYIDLHLDIDGCARRVLARLPVSVGEERPWLAGTVAWCWWEPRHSRLLSD